METALEMISPILLKYNTEGKIRVGDIVDVMKQYAEQVAETALEDASEQAECFFNENAIWGQQQYEVSKYSITSTPIKLP